eukprot:m.53020 g.53020  ORF g.53020 m.53020 type:complete len:221 (-) comp15434_c0_seq20:1667-2329(-)
MTLISENLQKQGYYTTMAGKWHAGAHFEGQIPMNRGFNSSFCYLNGEEDHYTQVFSMLGGVDLYEDEGPALGKNGTYGGTMYVAHHLQAIKTFVQSGHENIFLYAPFQNTHAPLQVPAEYLNTSITPNGGKQTFFGMIRFLDEGVGKIYSAFTAADLWDNTLLVFSADNGGEQAVCMRTHHATSFRDKEIIGRYVEASILISRAAYAYQPLPVADFFLNP